MKSRFKDIEHVWVLAVAFYFWSDHLKSILVLAWLLVHSDHFDYRTLLIDSSYMMCLVLSIVTPGYLVKINRTIRIHKIRENCVPVSAHTITNHLFFP